MVMCVLYDGAFLGCNLGHSPELEENKIMRKFIISSRQLLKCGRLYISSVSVLRKNLPHPLPPRKAWACYIWLGFSKSLASAARLSISQLRFSHAAGPFSSGGWRHWAFQHSEGLWAWPVAGAVRSTSYPTLRGCKCLLRNLIPRVAIHPRLRAFGSRHLTSRLEKDQQVIR